MIKGTIELNTGEVKKVFEINNSIDLRELLYTLGYTTKDDVTFGAFVFIYPLLHKLGFGEIVDKHCPMGNDGYKLTHGQVAEIIISILLSDPGELRLYKVTEWATERNFKNILEIEPEFLNDHRIGRCLEVIREKQADIFQEFICKLNTIYKIKLDKLFFDTTPIQFQGVMEECEKIERGYAHGGNASLVQLLLGLVVNSDGIPVIYENYSGNTNDQKTLSPILNNASKNYPNSSFMFIFDRGITNIENIVAILKKKQSFAGGFKLKQHKAEFANLLRNESLWEEIEHKDAKNKDDSVAQYQAIETEYKFKHEGKDYASRLIIYRNKNY